MKNVYVKVGAEWGPDEPIPYIESEDFWKSHESDEGYVMLVIDENGKISQ